MWTNIEIKIWINKKLTFATEEMLHDRIKEAIDKIDGIVVTRIKTDEIDQVFLHSWDEEK